MRCILRVFHSSDLCSRNANSIPFIENIAPKAFSDAYTLELHLSSMPELEKSRALKPQLHLGKLKNEGPVGGDT
jgi:hypothetical protein